MKLKSVKDSSIRVSTLLLANPTEAVDMKTQHFVFERQYTVYKKLWLQFFAATTFAHILRLFFLCIFHVVGMDPNSHSVQLK